MACCPARYALQLCRKAASLAAMSARNIGCSSIDGEYLLAGTSGDRRVSIVAVPASGGPCGYDLSRACKYV